MDTLGYLGQGFGVALTPYNLVTALSGTLIGTVVGLLPGLGPINGVALLIPIAFALGLPPESALILLAAVYLGCEYGGRISSILLNIPGEASTVMTALDGYPMARQGLAGVALSLSAWSSFIGALIATCGMVMFAPLLAKWAIAFGICSISLGPTSRPSAQANARPACDRSPHSRSASRSCVRPTPSPSPCQPVSATS